MSALGLTWGCRQEMLVYFYIYKDKKTPAQLPYGLSVKYIYIYKYIYINIYIYKYIYIYVDQNNKTRKTQTVLLEI